MLNLLKKALTLKIKLGIIGISEGNGHPYSWSAICNGYNPNYMQSCPFPAIPDYLSKRKFPDDAIAELKVTHIWTQNSEISMHIAMASNIEHVVDKPEDMLGNIDGILLARDDAENHYKFAEPFLRAGLPVYIDKPVATTIANAEALYNLEQYEGQIFTCTALRFAKELLLNKEQMASIGTVKYIIGYTPKKWDTYAVHVIEPIIANFGVQGNIKKYSAHSSNSINTVMLQWETGLQATLLALGDNKAPIKLSIIGEAGYMDLVFTDSFSCFKQALQIFALTIKNKNRIIPLDETLNVVKVIEIGKK